MSNLEHYFENLLFDGRDCTGEPNKRTLTEEEQSAVEACADYIIYTVFANRAEFLSWVRGGVGVSVLIKGMEMPKNCKDCIFCVNNWCVINSRLHHIKGAEETTQYCPLIPVPSHGILINADVAAKLGWTISRTYSATPTEMMYEIKTDEILPTIIKAEVRTDNEEEQQKSN